MKAIQYRDDGKFYGLVNVPAEPSDYCADFGDFILICGNTFCRCDSILKGYRDKLQACIAAEIINPEVLNRPWRPSPGDVVTDLKPGDIFPCPENIEFEEDQFCAYHNLNCSYCGTCAGSCYKPEKVIRLKLKQEVKTEESQDKLWNEVAITFMNKYSKPAIEENKSKFTIQRNKNGNE